MQTHQKGSEVLHKDRRRGSGTKAPGGISDYRKATTKTVRATKPKRPISRRTKTRAAQERIYRKRVSEWLKEPKNHRCIVCTLLYVPPRRATQCHHSRGRRGALLLMEEFWKPVSMWGHNWIDRNPDKARDLGLLCNKGLYNTVPRE